MTEVCDRDTVGSMNRLHLILTTAAVLAAACYADQTADYTSARGVRYFWEGGTFRPADIEAVEDAYEASGLPPHRAAFVQVYAEPFACGSVLAVGCTPGWVQVVGEPWRCAGQSALKHELLHAAGVYSHADERFREADKPVGCE